MTAREQEKARKARNAYQREWRRKNPERVKRINERYWLRRVQNEGGGADNESEKSD